MIPALIYVLVPAVGLASFLQVCSHMRRSAVSQPPVAPWFWLYFSYGGLLLVILTAAFWKWSGMASLGVGYLILCAPILLAVQALRLRPQESLSSYHRIARRLSLGYVVVAGITIVCWVIVTLLSRRGAV